jgi:hypothetical protein
MGLRESIVGNSSSKVSKALKTEGVTEELLLLALNEGVGVLVVMSLIKKSTFLESNTVCLLAAVENKFWTACHQLIVKGALVTEACLQRAREVDAPEDTLDKFIQALHVKPAVELKQATPAEEGQRLLLEAGLNTEDDVQAVIRSTHPRTMAIIRIVLVRLLSAPTNEKALQHTLVTLRGIPRALKIIDLRGINLDVLGDTVSYQILHAIPQHAVILEEGSQADVDAAEAVMQTTQEKQAALHVPEEIFVQATNFILLDEPVGEQGIPVKETQERPEKIRELETEIEALQRIFYAAIAVAPVARRRPQNQVFREQLIIVRDITLENFRSGKAGFSSEECTIIAGEVTALSSKASTGLKQEDVDAFTSRIKPYTTCSRMKAALAGLIGAALGLIAGFVIGGVPGAAIGAVAGFGLFGGGYAYQHQKNHPLTQVAEAAKTMIAAP